MFSWLFAGALVIAAGGARCACCGVWYLQSHERYLSQYLTEVGVALTFILLVKSFMLRVVQQLARGHTA